MVKKIDAKGEMQSYEGESRERSQKRVKRGGSIRRYTTRTVVMCALA